MDTGVGLSAEEHDVGGIAGGLALVLLDGVEPSLEIIVLGVGTAALCAVHPDFHKVTVVAVDGVAQNFLQLGIVVVIVVDGVGSGIAAVAVGSVVAVVGIMDVPGGQVQTHIHVVLGAGCGDLSQDVAAHAIVVVVAVAGLAGLVGGVGAVPDAEAVVMLGSHDQGAEAGLLQISDQLLCVKVVFQLEDLVRSLAAVMLAPLDLVERIGAEMTERRQSLLVILILVGIRDHIVLLGCCRSVVCQGIHGHIVIRGIRLGSETCNGCRAHQCQCQHQCDSSFCCTHSFSSLFFTIMEMHPYHGCTIIA